MNLIVITGAKSGLGSAIHNRFQNLEDWEIVSLSFDFSRPLSNFKELFSKMPDYERVIFVNNAFEMVIGNDFDYEVIARNIHINITAPITFFNLLKRKFKQAEFVNITSGAAQRGISHWSLYCTGKAAMEGYVRALEAEGYKAINFEPGVINTDMQAKIRESDFPDVDKFRNLNLRQPEDVAQELYDKLK